MALRTLAYGTFRPNVSRKSAHLYKAWTVDSESLCSRKRLTAILQLPFEDVTAKQNLEMNITIHGVKVTVANLDDKTLCPHYHAHPHLIPLNSVYSERWFSC